MKTTDNMLQETGASSLSESIKKNTTLQKLYLNCLSIFERNKKHDARDKRLFLDHQQMESENLEQHR